MEFPAPRKIYTVKPRKKITVQDDILDFLWLTAVTLSFLR